MDNHSQSKSHWAIDGGLVIVLVTSLAYSVAFAFEAGYLGFFHAPLELVEVNLKGLLLCAAGGAGVFYTLINVTDQIRLYMPDSLSPRVQRMLTVWLVVLALVSFCLWAQGAKWLAWLFFLVLFSLVALFDFVFPLLWGPKSMTYSERIESSLSADKDTDKTLAASLGRRIGREGMIAVLVALGTVLLANSVGVYVAARQERFLTTTSTPTCIVLRLRAEGMLCVSLDEKARTVTPDFRVLPTEGTVVSLRKVGRIHVPELTITTSPSGKESATK